MYVWGTAGPCLRPSHADGWSSTQNVLMMLLIDAKAVIAYRAE
eukprot:COSAG01_NODE_728_length_14028_cov_9.273889_6_plen_43_part_00